MSSAAFAFVLPRFTANAVGAGLSSVAATTILPLLSFADFSPISAGAIHASDVWVRRRFSAAL
ncbi:hypothetical protein GCM10025868_30930 [Angustibacter aerolatus]|uniref:Major facilitator superfamily (MFS) profile domain-containing protein n=1 Tax=Angustibacter aerolatus TaxID=1162965 RepID=A0ABQ6JKB8_9ACTN|nr:hypothetical protein GCM10025868_30930 [Angustibacter aerolatus]